MNPVAEPGQFICLAGYAGCGKDVLGDQFIHLGYVRHNYGDVIKAFYDPFLRGEETIHALVIRIMRHSAPGITEQDIHNFTVRSLLPYVQAGHRISGFTEDRSVKHHIRPILERGGELVYAHIQRLYTERLDELLEAGVSVINTRLCAISEAENAEKRGARIYLIERNNWAPATTWDLDTVQALEDGDWIDAVLYNDYPTGEDWSAACADLTPRLIPQRSHAA